MLALRSKTCLALPASRVYAYISFFVARQMLSHTQISESDEDEDTSPNFLFDGMRIESNVGLSRDR